MAFERTTAVAGISDLTVLGPVRTLRADIERAGMAYELTVEYWTLPDESHLLEMSIKCPPSQGHGRQITAAIRQHQNAVSALIATTQLMADKT